MRRKRETVDIGPVPDDPAILARMIQGHLRAALREIATLSVELERPAEGASPDQADLFCATHAKGDAHA